jgi:hypothetical protein
MLRKVAYNPSGGRHATGRLFPFVGNPTDGPRVSVVGAEREEGSEMWLALAVITLAAAIGFNVLALAIESSVSRGKQETASEGDGVR